MMNRLAWIVPVLAAAAALSAWPAMGQEAPSRDKTRPEPPPDAVQLQQALDRQVQLELKNARIAELFDSLGKQTGVQFILDEESLAYLPYGKETRLDVTVKNVTLRQALTPILARQGLKWEIDGQVVLIRPTEALARTCRRATFEELTALGKLNSVQIKPTSEGGPVIQQLREIEGLKDLRILPHVQIDPQADYARADMALPGVGASWLDMLCHGKDWTWYLWGDQIMIVTKADQVRRQIEKHVTLSYKNASLAAILLDLARQAHVGLTLSPGVMSYLPPATCDQFNLTMGEASVAEALQVISGATGLEFVFTSDGVTVQASEALKSQAQGAGPARQRSPFFVRLTLPGPNGMNIEVFMRPEELPEDVVAMIEQAKEDFLAQIRGEGPASQPQPRTTTAP